MKFFLNKFFWLGTFSLLILIGIPLTVYFVKQQQDLITRAKPTSVITFEPTTKVASLNQNFDIDIFLIPNENAVTFVKLKLLFDLTKIQIVKLTPNTQSFPLILENPRIGTGSATLTLGIGAQPLAAITTRTKVTTVTVKPIALTSATTPTRLSFDPSETQILSLANTDEPAENVLSQSVPLDITITSTGVGLSPSPQASITPTDGLSNISPSCTQLLISPTAIGSAPFSATLEASGTDTDGLISKATFNFGDGQTQDVSEEDNIDTTATSEVLHTYQTIGTYIASATFTDDEGGVGASCTQTITVTDAATLSLTPTASPTATFTPTPTLAQPGSVETTIGILAAVLITIIGGIILFTL